MEPEYQEDDVSVFEGDLFVSRPAAPASSLQPAQGSLGQSRFRSELRDAAQVSMSPSAALDEIRIYEAAPKSMAPRIADKMRSAV